MVEISQLVSLCEGALNRPELRFTELLVPWIMIVGVLGFLMAWLVVAIMEHTVLSRYVWHLPLFFVGLVVLFSSLIGMVSLSMKAKLFNYLITLIIVGLAVWAAVSLYLRYIEHPWTRDGQVRANIVGIAPRVSGPIIHVAVR